jgi:thiamine biosynthesis lipoprotein
MAAGAMQTRTAGWQALGTGVLVRVTEPAVIAPARAIVEAELDRVDRACSRFRPDSELSRLNGSAGTTLRVSDLFVEAIGVALRAAQLTGGDVDPALGEALELAGYDRDWQLLEPAAAAGGHPGLHRAPSAPTLRAIRRSGWRAIELDRVRSTVRLPHGIKLDLGATAKAWAADRTARAVHRATGAGVLVSLGGDIATAGQGPVGGWRIHVTDDHRAGPDAAGQTVTIADGGLATSSTTARRWSHAGAEMHHILDPGTGEPAAGPWRTVSVAAGSCTDANIASTAAVVRGSGAPAWLEALDLPARLVDHDGRARRVGGWPADGDRAAELCAA